MRKVELRMNEKEKYDVIKEEYEKYEEGLLEESDINKLLMGGYFKYNNDNEIVKGNVFTLVK